MNINYDRLRRIAYSMLAMGVLGATTLPALSGTASAAQVTARSVQLSSAAPGNGGGTNVIYKVSFTVDNAATNIGGVAIDFCSNTPIVGDACTAPTGLDSNDTTLSVNNQTNISGLSVDAANSTANKVILTRTAGAPTAAALSFELGNGTTNGFTNPNAVTTSNAGTQGTFYARIYTYTTSAAAQGHSTGTPTGYTDYGGVAMSTSRQITVTAKVQETLSFCVYTGADCAAGGAAVTLGDTNGVLSTAGNFVDVNTKYYIATNAGGASPSAYVRFKAPLLTSGSNTIATIGTSATTPAASNTSLFGLCTNQVSGSLTAIAPYNSAGCSSATQTAGTGSTGGVGTAQFAFDTAAAASTFGDDLASTSAGTGSEGRVAFVGQTNATQAAGIYTSTFNFIATATY